MYKVKGYYCRAKPIFYPLYGWGGRVEMVYVEASNVLIFYLKVWLEVYKMYPEWKVIRKSIKYEYK
jgi:hypothetical protein